MKKKSVAILTFASGSNYGAYLQAFALSNYIKSLGYYVEVIKYDSVMRLLYEHKDIVTTDYKKLKFNLMKTVAFFGVSKRLFSSGRVFKPIKYLSKFDICVVGSDVIWDFSNKKLGDLSPNFLLGVNCKKKVSYAASVGSSTDIENFPKRFITALMDFDKISVRDEMTKKLINLNDLSAERVLDPTFLIDWSNHISYKVKKRIQSNYYLVYAYDLTKEEFYNVVGSDKRDCIVVAVGYSHDWADINLGLLDPFNWLCLVKYAEKVVTSTFHGSIFSILFEKKFACKVTNSNFSKLNSLLEGFEYDTKLVDGSKFYLVSDDQNKYKSTLYASIKKSKEFVEKALGS